MPTPPPTPPDDATRILAADTLEDQSFHKLDLAGRALEDKELYGCSFLGGRLAELRLVGCKLEGCVFRDCDLTRFVPVRTAFRDVRFERCKLMGVDWSEISPNPDLGFDHCVLKYSSFVGMKLRKTVFRKCSVVEANFIEVNLTEADFAGSDLTGASFRRANLTRADLSDARGAFVPPDSNVVKGLKIPLESAVALARSLGFVVAFD